MRVRSGLLPLLCVAFAGCAAGERAVTVPVNAVPTHCFVLPGSRSGMTKSFRVEDGGRLAEAGAVGGGANHMRAAFHPDGRTLYLNSVGPAGWGPPPGVRTWEDGIHVRAYSYDPAACTIGALLGTGRMGDEAPDNNRAYGLEVHPDGRWLYQTTNSLRRIRLFDLPEDRIPVPRESFDVTAGGEHVCRQLRRLAIHPSARYLYVNCNNGGGAADAIQVWSIGHQGAISLLDHHRLPAQYGGVFDPVLHPGGQWLYQPVSGHSDAAAGSGAYVLVYRVGDDGRLTLHDQVAVRTIAGIGPVSDTAYVLIAPMNLLLHPGGGTAYISINAVIMGWEVRPHGVAILAVQEGGARLTERAWAPAPADMSFNEHHGATLAAYGDEMFLYAYLTNYNEMPGGVLQRLRVAEDHVLEPRGPPWVTTGLFDGRQPISLLRE